MPLIRDVQLLSRQLGEGAAAGLLQACARAPKRWRRSAPAPGIEPRLRALFGLEEGDVEALIARQCCDELFDIASLARVAEANAGWGAAKGLACADLIAGWRSAQPAARAAQLDALVGTCSPPRASRARWEPACSRSRPIMPITPSGWLNVAASCWRCAAPPCG
jgi:ATP-dependent helicase/nuclease subunit A